MKSKQRFSDRLLGAVHPECDPPLVNFEPDPVLVTCPGGDAAYEVIVTDQFGDPIVGFEDLWIELQACNDLVPCPGDSIPIIIEPMHPADDSGTVRFVLTAGGCDTDCEAELWTSDGLITTVPVRSVDTNGDLGVSLGVDFDSTSLCCDYDNNGLVDQEDLQIFSDHIGHYCGLSPCERFTYEFVLDVPDTTYLDTGSVIGLSLTLINNNFDYCYIETINFYSSGFGVGLEEQLIHAEYYNKSLRPGELDVITLEYTIPNLGHGCLITKFTTDCCPDDSVILTQCAQTIWPCNPEAGVDTNYMCYEFVVLADEPIDSFEYAIHLPDTTWNATDPQIEYDTTITYQICASDISTWGDTAVGYIYVYTDGEPIPTTFRNRVTLNWKCGDVDNNCIIEISDAVYLINYIFVPGSPAPIPYESGDVDCSGVVEISDAVYIINYVFIPDSPPPCDPDGDGEPDC